MSTVSLLTPIAYQGTVTTPSGQTYHVVPWQIIQAGSVDLEFLLEFGFTVAPSGGDPLLAEVDAPATTLDFLFPKGYHSYEMELLGLTSTVVSDVIQFLLSTDGGKTWLSSGYNWVYFYTGTASNSSGLISGAASGAFQGWSGFDSTPGSGHHLDFKFRWNNLDSAVLCKTAYGQSYGWLNGDQGSYPTTIYFDHTTLSPVNGIRVQLVNGTFATGKGFLYGVL